MTTLWFKFRHLLLQILNPLMVAGALKHPRLKNIIKNRLLEIAFQFFCFCIPRTLLLVAKNKRIACGCPVLFLIFFFTISRSSAQFLGGVRLDFFYTTDFWDSEHSEEKAQYMKCTFCLGLVGVLYPSALELPVISS